MIVVVLQVRTDFRIEVAEQRRDVTVAFHLEIAHNAVAVAVQIAALVVKRFVPMSGEKLVFLANDRNRRLSWDVG